MGEIIYCGDCQNFRNYGGDAHECDLGILRNPSERDFCSKAEEKNKWIVETIESEAISETSLPRKSKICKCPNCHKCIDYKNKDEYKHCPYCGIRIYGYKERKISI